MPARTNDGIKKRCPCGKRQWSKCAHPWHFSFHHNGTEHRYSLEKIARARQADPPASKSEAATWRDRLRGEIRAGTFIDPDAPVVVAPVETRLTFGDVCDRYEKRHVEAPTRRPRARKAMMAVLDLIRSTDLPAAQGATIRLEAKPFDSFTKADIEAFRDARRAVLAAGRATLARAKQLEVQAAEAAEGQEENLVHQARSLRASVTCRPGSKGGEVGINRLLARLRHVFSWAIEEGYVTVSPFKRGDVTIVHLETRAETARTRRLDPGDEEKLCAHAEPHLRALIIAALSTGCRLGELLSWQWSQIQRDDAGAARWLLLPADLTKTNEARMLPIGWRLRAELEMRRTDPEGKDHEPDAHVFGNEVGEPIASIKTAWRATCRRAGIRGLHFHDLRREFGSRLLESGAAQHDVRDFLGHANITTTSRYLKSTPLRLERALAALEAPIRTLFAQTDDPADVAAIAIASEESPKVLIQ